MNTALKVFDEMLVKNVVSWNSILSGYLKLGHLAEAQRVFNQIPRKDVVSWNSMLTGCAKSGDMDQACLLFEQMPERNYASWNAMISGLFTTGGREVWIMDRVIYKKFGIEFDDHLVTALINLYAKCGNIGKAYELFDGLKKKDVVAYSAMILACGINGKVYDAVNLFTAMVDAQIEPNLATFSGLLTAYNHAGLVEEGYQCFNSMMEHQLVPLLDHYAIMVDLLGRAGRLQEAYELIESMPMRPCAEVWGALLLACEVHSNVDFGEIAAKHCFELEPTTTGYYSLLANIYASVGRWDDARKLREVIKDKKLAKIPGRSWTEIT
ncbi:hypothetical protein GH714_009571 [Hevea brasiliensis]|uniref:Pentacotripeptide-repeat region of PRORP domain-containing protein n=1 Tax=Hevea brasiliensis TaxID=3981 RepID=A0A6A6MJL9_HEVBR|nr:hypothetical protein GH714_009571 [Hevea brasiliensis]